MEIYIHCNINIFIKIIASHIDGFISVHKLDVSFELFCHRCWVQPGRGIDWLVYDSCEWANVDKVESHGIC